MKSSIVAKLEALQERHEEVEALLGDAGVIGDQERFRALSREYAQLTDVTRCFRDWQQVQEDIETAEMMLDDPEMREMANEELKLSREKREVLEQQLQVLLLPKDPDDERSCFVEVRAGTGGDEAAIFAGDLFRMYSRYAESRRWQVEIISANESGDRSDRNRTYNCPQGRVTDHRINLTLYRLDETMEGKLDTLIEPIVQEYQADQLAALAGQD